MVSMLWTEILKYFLPRSVISHGFLHCYDPYLHHAMWVGLRAVYTLKDSPWTHIIFVLYKMSPLDFFGTVLIGTRYLLKKAEFQVDLFKK